MGEDGYDVYLEPRRGRPRKIGRHPADKPMPTTWTYDGRVLYFAGADLIDRTMTYAETR